MTPESQNGLLLCNDSVSTIRGNGNAATGLTHVSWQRIKQCNTQTFGGSDPSSDATPSIR
jgi:hypothetical protein